MFDISVVADRFLHLAFATGMTALFIIFCAALVAAIVLVLAWMFQVLGRWL